MSAKIVLCRPKNLLKENLDSDVVIVGPLMTETILLTVAKPIISVRGARFGYILLYDMFQKIFFSQTTRRGRTWIGKGVLG